MSKKEDLSTYNLIYLRKSDKRKFLGKMITKMNRKLIDSVTGEVISLNEYRLRKDYEPVIKFNKGNMSKVFKERFFRQYRGKKKEAA